MSSKPHILTLMNDAQLRQYIIQLEERIGYMSDSITRLQNDSLSRDHSVRSYHERVEEMNDVLRRDVEVLMGSMTGEKPLPSFDRSMASKVSPPEDITAAVREMTKTIIRSRIKSTSGALTSESAIANLVHRSIDAVVLATVNAEMGIDSRGDIDLKKSKVAQRIKVLLEGRVERLFAEDGAIQTMIGAAIDKAAKRFLRESGRSVFDYTLDHLRARFHDVLTRRIQSEAENLVTSVVQDVFEKAMVEEMPFIEPYVALLRLGQEVEVPDD